MANTGKVTGLQTVMANLNKEIERIKGGSMKGLIEASIVIHRGTEDYPCTPVDEGNLRASWFTTSGSQPAGSGKFTGPKASEVAADHERVTSEQKAVAQSAPYPVLILGFSANYAAFVHENYGANFQRTGSGAGFLVTSVMTHWDDILKKIRENTRIK